MPTLYERLGGQPAISAVVDKFYEFMLDDDRVSPFFRNINMDKQIERQKQFLVMVTGGPYYYEGADMKEAHRRFKITQMHFDATWENLFKALTYFNVGAELIS